MTVRDALNSALDEEMSADRKVFLMGEEVRTVGKKLVFPGFDVRSFFLCSCFIFWAQVGEYQGFKVHTRLDFNIWRDEFVDLYSCEDQMSTLYICQSALYLQFCIDIQRAFGQVWSWEGSWYTNYGGYFCLTCPLFVGSLVASIFGQVD